MALPAKIEMRGREPVKFYIARIKNGRRLVDIMDRTNKKVEALKPRGDLVDYGSRFAWGKNSEAARALSLALLANALNDTRALELHRKFAAEHLSNLRHDAGWHMSDQTIRRLVEALPATQDQMSKIK